MYNVHESQFAAKFWEIYGGCEIGIDPTYTSNVDLCENLPNIYLQNGFSDILRINEIYKCGPWGDVTTLNIRAHGDH